MRVLILTEGYSHTGYGHISRCTAIAQVFRERNANVTFIVNGDESVKNLLLSMLYKIENGYADYSIVKFNALPKADFM